MMKKNERTVHASMHRAFLEAMKMMNDYVEGKDLQLFDKEVRNVKTKANTYKGLIGSALMTDT